MRDQRGAKLFGERYVACVVGGEIVSATPNPGKKNEMRISSNPEVEQIANCLIGAARWDRSAAHETPHHLDNLKIQQVRSVQGFVARVNSLFNAFADRCL